MLQNFTLAPVRGNMVFSSKPCQGYAIIYTLAFQGISLAFNSNVNQRDKVNK